MKGAGEEADKFGYAGKLPPANFNMARYCLRAGNAPSDKHALTVVNEVESQTWTYGALEASVLRAAHAFRARHALPSGARVIIRLRNKSTYPVAFFGAIAGGLVPIPASPDLTARELDFLLEDSEARAILLDESLPHDVFDPDLAIIPEARFAAEIASGPEASYANTKADDPAFLIYTSGTTATPKGVLHAHRSAWGRRPMYQCWYGIKPGDRVLHAGSFNWTYTLGTGLSDPWANGATAVVYTGVKTPEVWPSLISSHDISIFAAVPGVFRQILKYADAEAIRTVRLRHGLCAGETLPQSIANEWRERTGTILYEALGQSELSTYISSSPSVPLKPGRIGKPQPGRSVVILPEEGGDEPLAHSEAGLIAVHRSDPGLMLGYLKRPAEEAGMFRGEWFVGGDAGMMDEENYIAHLGRRNELMNAGGFRVSPLEVEEQLSQHPSVAEAAVAEVTIREGVSIIAAFIVLNDGAAADRTALEPFAKSRLATYKQPKDYIFVDTLPRTANGKLKRSELRRLFPNQEIAGRHLWSHNGFHRSIKET